MMKLKSSLLWSGAALLSVALVASLMRPSEPVAISSNNSMPRTDPNAFARSQEGTRADGDLKVAANQALVVDAELGHLFDYYLSALGEKSLDAIKIETERELDRKLSPQAAAQAKKLLARYLDYKRELAEVEKKLPAGKSQADAIRARLNALNQTRARFFSAQEITGLFGFTDAYDRDALARIEVEENKTLTPEQKEQALTKLDQQLPPEVREARDAPLKLARLEEQVSQMRAKGGSDQDVYQLRAKAFSPEAAARLAEVDREEAQWQARIKTYLAERNRIKQSNQPEAQQLAAISALRQQQFSEQEQIRLPAYE
ncbi:MAG: hypothetical protein RL748_1674 [Pseudomonadota bacterium]|jgi:lipase chaperone LimK